MNQHEDIITIKPEKKGEYIRYNLDSNEFDILQADLINCIKQKADENVGQIAVWFGSDSRYANLVRTLEAVVFPEITTFISAEVEDCSKFLVIVDPDSADGRIVHAFRSTGQRFNEGNFAFSDNSIEQSTGIAMLEEVLDANPGLSREELVGYYSSRGIDLSECISIETNFRVGEKLETENGLRTSDLGYIAIFNTVTNNDDGRANYGIFAHLNEQAITSLSTIGVSFETVAGRDDLGTPSSTEGQFDEHYYPYFIPASETNMSVFRQLVPLGPPEISI
ncbi:hypothetical protein H6801_01295 [Candidatus Nomurabacteria bacterium]|nr:hypothetical protein [Candidatus Saccharibacteria bacterium]MCB9821989.1 hypothetical protein [Candidatus Nomurabacteria bacterium]